MRLTYKGQGEDAAKLGDFWTWGYAAFGAEIADLVPDKYVVWCADSRDPSKVPDSSAMLALGSEYCIFVLALCPSFALRNQLPDVHCLRGELCIAGIGDFTNRKNRKR